MDLEDASGTTEDSTPEIFPEAIRNVAFHQSYILKQVYFTSEQDHHECLLEHEMIITSNNALKRYLQRTFHDCDFNPKNNTLEEIKNKISFYHPREYKWIMEME